MKNLGKKKKGFTLIELIIVLAVMAIIALIAIPNFASVRENARIKADNQSCEVIERVVLTHTVDNSIKTESAVTLYWDGTNLTGATGAEFDALKTDLEGVEEPQQKGKTKYEIAITGETQVAVTVVD